ncbi:MAG: SCP2 sterol-binding domain-containing protein [Proteobacteria bacterium]|nr:SCP2 sterol-binding domain-containing protein [Pseudomonadota bacterium]
MSTPTEFFTKKGEQLAANPDALKGINATYQFNLEGDDGGEWTIALTDDLSEVRAGTSDDAQCTIAMTATDFMAMIGGSLNPNLAFMTGKLKVTGEIGLALKLQSILN